jgi:inorganic pyrophosphatase/exopolyphosphatase
MSNASDQRELTILKQEVERLKRDAAVKEGERNSILDRIKKEFNVKTIDEAYVELEKKSADIEIKQERKEELIAIAKEKLAGYRR